MERLFNHFGEPLVFGGALLLIVLPLITAGVILRRRSSRGRLRWGMVEAARRALRDVTAGRVAVVGTWRKVTASRGLVEEGEHCALVDHDGDNEIRDGERVLVVGFATHQEDDPRGSHYRSGGRPWLIEGSGEDLVVTTAVDVPSQSLRSARIAGGAGAALLAAGIAVAVAVGGLCYRAAHDQASLSTSRYDADS